MPPQGKIIPIDDPLLKKIEDSEDVSSCLDEYGFYKKNSKYFTEVKNKNAHSEKELSNFVGESLFHLDNGTNNTKRIIKIQRYSGEIYIVEIQSSEMKIESFETILKSHSCTFYGSAYELKRIFAKWMDDEIRAIIIETLGYNPENNLYAFSNAIYTKNNQLLKVNEIGIIEDLEAKKKYYFPAFGFANKNNQSYEGERKFVFIEGKLNFEEWSKLYFETFESNGAIGILFLILSLFWDIVFNEVGFFPFLFLFGAYGTGKTSMTEFLLRVFGKDYIGIPLNNASQVGLSRSIASRNNSIFYLKEYTPETDETNQDLILTAYDGSGRVTGIKSNDNKTSSASVKSAIIFDGNHLPNQRTAVLSRMILLYFQNNKFSEIQRTAFGKLESIKDDGFGNVLIDILEQREFFSKNFKRIFDENIHELRTCLKGDFAERTVKHIALILTPAKLLHNKLKFPFTFNEITHAVVENAIEQNRLLKQSDEITVFWQSFSNGVKNNSLIMFQKDGCGDNKKIAHYNVKNEDSGAMILQIKLQNIFPEYVRYCKNNSLRFSDQNSLRMLLTSKSYTPFINNTQKGRGEAYTDFKFGSCYQFNLTKNENIISINEVELNL